MNTPSSRKPTPSRHDILNMAIMVAVSAHSEQKDMAGLPYIYHPLRVMAAVDDIEHKIVAVLHDVIEDTDYVPRDLRQAGIPHRLVQAVIALTRLETESYEAYLERVARDPIAIQVKLADLHDNMNRTPLKDATKQLRNMKRYLAAKEYLVGVLNRPEHWEDAA